MSPSRHGPSRGRFLMLCGGTTLTLFTVACGQNPFTGPAQKTSDALTPLAGAPVVAGAHRSVMQPSSPSHVLLSSLLAAQPAMLNELGSAPASGGQAAALKQVGAAPASGGQAVALKFSTSTQASECSNCHSDKYAEWAEGEGTDLPLLNVWDSSDEEAYTSGNYEALDPDDTQEKGNLHSLAWKDYYFQLLYHQQPSAEQGICRRCHMAKVATSPVTQLGVYAPRANSQSAANSQEGVTCVTCHLSASGEILGPEDVPSPHGVTASTDFSDGVGVCASCHTSQVYGSFTSTAQEHSDQVTDGSTCVSCHMTDGQGGEGRHGFPGGSSQEYRSRAVDVSFSTSVTAGTSFQAQVANAGAGHNVPTGDTFRAFSLRMRLTDASSAQVVNRETFFTPEAKTPVFTEQVSYERQDPIAYQHSRTIDYGILPSGTYTLHAELAYYQIKPTQLNWFNGTVEDVAAYNVSTVETWDTTVTVK